MPSHIGKLGTSSGWSAIEALYGGKDVAKARIYSFFGNKNLVDGYNCPIYEKGDIPSCFYATPESLHTLGKMVPLIYEVRNASAHGQKVPDSHFVPIAHPLGQGIVGLDALAEAATFIIRKTVIEILKRGLRDEFKDRAARENFWLYQHGLDKKQSRKRLKGLEDSLKGRSVKPKASPHVIPVRGSPATLARPHPSFFITPAL